MGNIGDGGWEICDDYEYRPIQPCIAYSFGYVKHFPFLCRVILEQQVNKKLVC